MKQEPKPRNSLAELLIQWDSSRHLNAEAREWLDIAPVGKEFGAEDRCQVPTLELDVSVTADDDSRFNKGSTA